MLTEFSTNQIQAILEERLRAAPQKEMKRILCLWLCNQATLSSAEIAALIGWEARTVQRLRARLKRDGRQVLYQTHCGNRKALSREDEVSLLLGFLANPTSSLRSAYESKLGKKISDEIFNHFLYRFGLQPYVVNKI